MLILINKLLIIQQDDEAAAMINKQTGTNANQTEVEQAITKVQTTLQALNGDHNCRLLNRMQLKQLML